MHRVIPLILALAFCALNCGARLEFDAVELVADKTREEATIARLFTEYGRALGERDFDALLSLFDHDLLKRLEPFDMNGSAFVPLRKLMEIEVLAQKRLPVTEEQFRTQTGMIECVLRVSFDGYKKPEYLVCYCVRRGGHVALRTAPTGPGVVNDMFDFEIGAIDSSSPPRGLEIAETKEKQKAAQPGATDNPDDAQRLREGH